MFTPRDFRFLERARGPSFHHFGSGPADNSRARKRDATGHSVPLKPTGLVSLKTVCERVNEPERREKKLCLRLASLSAGDAT
jgi:hypothetical protein